MKNENLIDTTAKIKNSTIIQPVFLGADVIIENSVIGPHVSIGANTKVSNSIIVNSIIQENTKLASVNLKDSMIGNYAELIGNASSFSIGDYNSLLL